MKTTLAIIGSHPRTRDLFDWNRTDCDVWAFNEAVSNKSLPRADVIFQMHAEAIWRNPQNRNDFGHADWLKTQTDCLVYMQDKYADVPKSERYPLESILAMINNDPNHFLTSSVPQAMALAAYLGAYTRVEIWGVAMETNTEYQFQREGVAFWLGFLKGRGIDVYFADPTFQAPLYGYEGDVAIDYERFDQRVAELEPLIKDLSGKYIASLSNLDKAVDAFVSVSDVTNEKALYDAMHSQKILNDQLGFLDGQRQENERYKSKANAMRDAAQGRFLFSRQEFESAAKNLSDKAAQAHIEFVAAGTQLGNVHKAIMRAAKGSKKRNELAKAYRQMMQMYLNANNQVAVYKGAAQENFNYMAYLDKKIRAAGGSKSEAVLLEAMQHA